MVIILYNVLYCNKTNSGRGIRSYRDTVRRLVPKFMMDRRIFDYEKPISTPFLLLRWYMLQNYEGYTYELKDFGSTAYTRVGDFTIYTLMEGCMLRVYILDPFEIRRFVYEFDIRDGWGTYI